MVTSRLWMALFIATDDADVLGGMMVPDLALQGVGSSPPRSGSVDPEGAGGAQMWAAAPEPGPTAAESEEV